ncbi:MAG: cysteine--tRNA ligase [Clostridia bacterium]|nr:cysteine--tRNA ligase [Clostridia bacterium]
MKLYNTMSRSKEEFVPIKENTVMMYNCGPTVYNYFHIGNARNFIIFDTLRRYLKYRGYQVKFVQNFTDIDDKMINRANEEGITIKELADKFIAEYFEDADKLGVMHADVHPKATENIGPIIKLVKTLQSKGYAYDIDGDVYFDTIAYKDYGKLTKHNAEELESGARVDLDERKKNPADFALWKAKKPGEPFWKSPWGEGRPGWHIECSAMAMQYLGETIDIHSGGMDLQFPHHENEIAQSEAATGKPFANYWLHNGFINVDNRKMSKSLGNFFTVKDIIRKYDYEVLRFFILSAHYRSPINFSDALLESTKSGLDRLYECLLNLNHIVVYSEVSDSLEEEKAIIETIRETEISFVKHMDDDLNTADGISDLFNLVKQINLSDIKSKETAKLALAQFRKLGDVLGILHKEIQVEIPSEIEKIAKERDDARKNKDFKRSDELRDLLNEKGYLVEDSKEGYKIKIKL